MREEAVRSEKRMTTMGNHAKEKLKPEAIKVFLTGMDEECNTIAGEITPVKSWCWGHLELTLKMLVMTIDAQWEGMENNRVGEVRACTTSPMPDHKGFKLQ